MTSHQGDRGTAATSQRTAAQAEPLYGGSPGRRRTVRDIAAAKARGEKWPMLTAYDALTARVFDDAGIPVLLVGDSAAMVIFGHDSTIPVTVDELLPLTAAVVRGSSRAMVVADLPFGSYQASPQAALTAATRFLKEAGAHAVKLEGGHRVLRQVEELVAAGIPVMGHLGLTPQSVNAFGGYRVQGRGEDGEQLLRDAKALQAAGAFSVVLECVPGARLAGHGGTHAADRELREEVRRRRGDSPAGRAVFCQRGRGWRVPDAGVFLPLTAGARWPASGRAGQAGPGDHPGRAARRRLRRGSPHWCSL